MRKIYSGALLFAAAMIFTMGTPVTAMAYGPGSSVYHRGGPGVDYDYGTGSPGSYGYGWGPGGYDYGVGPSGVMDYGGPSGTQGNAQVTSDNVVRAYPGFNTNVPDTSSYEFNPDYWWDWDDDDWDD